MSSSTQPPADGIVTKPSPRPVGETISRLTQLIEDKGLTLFAVIDHSGEARRVGLDIPDTKLVPPGGIYANELFTEERGDATLFFPVTGEVRPVGRVGPISLSGAELAVIIHNGSHADLDRPYGALAIYVSEHALAVNGLIREYYMVGPPDTDDESAWKTEIGWPIFETRPHRQ